MLKYYEIIFDYFNSFNSKNEKKVAKHYCDALKTSTNLALNLVILLTGFKRN